MEPKDTDYIIRIFKTIYKMIFGAWSIRSQKTNYNINRDHNK